jgi:lipoprotein-anchoring transpeptidase ErfK/SrfK
MKRSIFLAFTAALLACAPASAQQVDLHSGSVVQTVATLHPGQFVWAPEVAPSGPMLLVVNVKTQRAVLFRNGVPIGATTISTGRPGYRTPTGAFTILQKQVEHYSSKYDNAPMPYMQRLTWYGVALHAGNLPGYPASHGCIRLPAGFAKLLFGVTRLGMTVVITDRAVTPRVAPTPEIVLNPAAATTPAADAVDWHPERSAEGPVSIIVSAPDRQAVVLRNGVVIGTGPVAVDGPVSGTWAYTLQSVDAAGQHWTRVDLSMQSEQDKQVPAQEWQRFHAPEAFRRSVAAILTPGTTVIVTPDSVRPGGEPVSVIEAEAPRKN